MTKLQFMDHSVGLPIFWTRFGNSMDQNVSAKWHNEVKDTEKYKVNMFFLLIKTVQWSNTFKVSVGRYSVLLLVWFSKQGCNLYLLWPLTVAKSCVRLECLSFSMGQRCSLHRREQPTHGDVIWFWSPRRSDPRTAFQRCYSPLCCRHYWSHWK